MVPSKGLTISVVIPVYNAEGTIIRALESVQAQTEPPFEVIVVDDGSTDRTAGIVRDGYPQIKYIRQANAGPASARNRGVYAARGEWIAFLDADDEWLPSKLSRQIELLKSAPWAGFSFTGMVNIREEGSSGSLVWSERDLVLLKGISQDIHGGRLLLSVFKYELLCRNYIYTPTVIVNRLRFVAAGGFNRMLKRAEDVDLWLRLARRCRAAFIEEPLVRRYRSRDSLSEASWECEKSLLTVCKSNYTELGDVPSFYRTRCTHALACLHRSVGLGYLSNGDTAEAKKHFAASCRSQASFRAVVFLLLPCLPVFGRRALRRLLKLISPGRSFAGEITAG